MNSFSLEINSLIDNNSKNYHIYTFFEVGKELQVYESPHKIKPMFILVSVCNFCIFLNTNGGTSNAYLMALNELTEAHFENESSRC